MSESNVGASTGIGIGSAIAIWLSMSMWNHIGWAFLHGIFGWGYVAYHWWMYR